MFSLGFAARFIILLFTFRRFNLEPGEDHESYLVGIDQSLGRLQSQPVTRSFSKGTVRLGLN